MFALSKLGWGLARPDTLIVLVLLAGLLVLGWRPKLGRGLLTVGVLALVAVWLLPLDSWTLKPLEERFAAPAELPEQVEGVIVLGGWQNSFMHHARGVPEVNAAADRLLKFVELARHYPHARLVASGGSGSFIRQHIKEGPVTRGALAMLGFDPERVLFEEHSRNTYENALYSREVAAPSRGGTWLLVTSAAHMPRSMGIFRNQGWNVIPIPVDYRTGDEAWFNLSVSPAKRLDTLCHGVREWLGLAAYRLLGRTDALFPAPKGSGAP